ncbi:hypothetical protein M1M34_gp118 [Haloarcula tailed virus 2]|uniref:Uncharacterized protein n=1 Tax=Haloarcula tailed virus 2 TaxID=2877989 RepID=A0AAE9BY50_9CAUD|nr:hypothetical protein M1M34_gp118 [Haloarcula tailed virus 2]UBF23215.1 hypothetical protein HATV-2_gp64 [Haloarcula tailed virus 2]
MNDKNEFMAMKGHLVNMTKVVKTLRNDSIPSVTRLNMVTDYLKTWLETEDVDYEERQNLASIIIGLNAIADGEARELEEDLMDEFEVIHSGMTIYVAKLYAEDQKALSGRDDAMYY